ncbi:DUF1501 domain-containing protein [Fimbriiglobus ruber]|uniref:DUF1501 domain-containing protein n=1 Tax=Fimbriiglobus ruber TaxID=1908690 RepID=A0A225E811_9BACT|nr:DUF1501 domain-containing protein [Fimbriiglobus ruber]OWK46908.1 hypothetical protein FRUB_00607 [Fimbriiglobus ruber]
MIRLDAKRPATFCDGATRRDFLHAGALAPLGLTLPKFLAAQAAAKDSGPSSGGKDGDVNCILLMLVGGPSQLDTFDPKPNAPAEIRGPFKPAATAVPGIQISELFPRTAALARHFSVVRSLYHTATAVHDTGYQMMQSGRLFAGGIEYPHMGCVLGYLKGGRGELPAHVLLPKPIGRTGGNLPHGESAGYLGKRFDPLILNADPSAPNFKVPDLLPPDYITGVRADRRQKLRAAVDGGVAAFDTSPAAKQMDDTFQLAYKLMSSPKAREAFDLQKESSEVRDRYGRTRFGQSCLMARRLIEAGVRFVTVNMFETVFDELTWDIHGSKPFTDINEMAKQIVPNFDRAYSALLEDLSARGLLSNTVVVATGEFGRTPKINPAGGRDHHPGVWSMLIGGGPIQGGRVVGESDELAYAPKSRPVTPGEIAATIYRALGLDPHKELPGPQNRPIPLADFGVKPIAELF